MTSQKVVRSSDGTTVDVRDQEAEQADITARAKRTILVDGTGTDIGVTSNALDINVASGTVIANIEGDYIDDSAFTVATDRGLAVGGVFTTDTIDSGDFGVFKINANRELFTQAIQSGTWNINDISGTVSLPTGASTLSEQQTQTTHLSEIEGAVETLETVDFMLGTDFSNVLGTTSLITITQADNLANTLDGIQTTAFGYWFDGSNWDRARGDATDGLLVNLGSNNDVVVSATDLDIRDLTSASDSVEVLQATHDNLNLNANLQVGDADVSTSNAVPVTNDTTIGGLTVNLGLNNDVTATGNVAHDAVDSGNPIKTGGIATDYEPDTDDEQGAAEVAAADRVDGAFNLRGEKIEGVNPFTTLLDNINITYDDSPTNATSQDIECWNYRQATLGFDLTESGTATDIEIEVQVSLDGTNFFPLVNGGLGKWIYDDATISGEGTLSRAYTFPIAAYKIRVKVIGTGTTASNTFTMANAYLYMRN